MSFPLQQSKEWEKLQNDLGEETFFVDEKSFQFLAILKKTKFGNYFYLPYGPVLADKNAAKKALEALQKLASEKNVSFIRIEPQDCENASYLLKLPNTKKSTDLNPAETWVLDLTGTDEEYKNRLPSRLLRYYRNKEKNDIKIETSKRPEDIKHLLKLQRALAKEKNISTFSENYLKTELEQPFSTLYLLKQKDQIIAAGLVFDYKRTRYNLQGAQTDEGRKLHATGILTIQLIKDAKDQGLSYFDFWGIAPENAPKNHPWAGFTAFKKSFGGYEVDYCGTYDIILNKSKYKLYTIARKVNRLKRKVLNQND